MLLKNKEITKNLTVMQKLSLLAGQMECGVPFFDVANFEQKNNGSKKATVYPSFKSIAHSWNTELIAKLSTELALREQKNNLNVAVTPNIGVKLHVYSDGMTEDPHLSGKLGVAYKKGVLKAGVMPVLSGCFVKKTDVEYLDLKPNKSFIRDYVIGPYELALSEHDGGAVMTSDVPLQGEYQDVNLGLINQFLRDKSFFSSPYICNVTQGETVGKCLNKGNSLILNSKVKQLEAAYNRYLDLKKGIDNGSVTQAEFEAACNDGSVLSDKTLNAAVDRYLNFAYNCEKCETAIADIDKSEYQADKLSFQASEESTVLLKNNNKMLPLNGKTRVAVIGRLASVKSTNALSFLETFLKSEHSGLPFSFNGYSDGFDFNNERNDELIDEACSHARSSDAVLLFVGHSSDEKLRMEERQSLKLPANQLALIEALAKTGKKIIAVLSGDVPPDTEFDEACSAVLLIPNGGTFTGIVLLKILSGEINPSGKLAFTLYDKPDSVFADIKKRKALGQLKVGAFFGYRYYDTARIKVKYPFGHGLSYTGFAYSKIKADEGNIAFRIKNTGKKAGYETVQIYLGKDGSHAARPLKELHAFTKIYLKPGQSKTVNLTLNYSNYTFADGKDGERKVEDGKHTAYVGSSVNDIRLQKSFLVKGHKFEDESEHLSDYIQTRSNIVHGRYTMDKDKKSKQKISVPVIFFIAMIFLAGVFDIIVPLTGNFDFLTYFFLILFNLFIPVAIVGLVFEGKKRRKQNLAAEKLNALTPENETELMHDLPPERLFLQEFGDKPEEQEVDLPVETPEAPSEDSLTLKTVTDNILNYMLERGLAVDSSSVRAVLSGLFASRLILLKGTDLPLLEEFFSYLCACFGTLNYVEDFSGQQKNLLFAHDENRLFTETALAKAINGANDNTHFVHIAALKGIQFPQKEKLLEPIVNLAVNPNQNQLFYANNAIDAEKQYLVPNNLWFMLLLSQTDSLDALPATVAQNAFIINVKLHKTKKIKEDPFTPKPISYAQFVKLCLLANKNCAVSENLYKKLDKLEEFVNSRVPYHIGNKEWRKIENFVSVFLSCDGSESEAAQSVANAKLLCQILTQIKASATGEESDLSFTFKKIFGNER